MALLLEREGADFNANTETAGAQANGRVAALPGGDFVVVWEDNSHLLGDANTGIVGQVFDASGAKVGADFLVNVTTTGVQSQPNVAALETGDFVVTWTDPSGTGGDSDLAVFARIFEPDATPVTGEFRVNTTTLGTQNNASVAPLTGGGFVVAWQDLSGQGGDTNGFGIKAQVFDNAGSKVGGEFLANTTTSGAQLVPSVTGLAGGGFAIGWLNSGGHGAVQLFDADGARVGSEVDVVSGTPSFVEAPVLTANGSGFVAAWREAAVGNTDIRAQLFDPAGGKIGPVFTVNDDRTGDQFLDGIASIPGGGFVVEWNSTGPDGTPDVNMSVYDADASKAGRDFTLDTGLRRLVGTGVEFTDNDLIALFTEGTAPNTEVRVQILTESIAGPTDIAISTNDVSETAINNLRAAILAASGPALNASYTYELTSDFSGAFTIPGGSDIDNNLGNGLFVQQNWFLDHETAPTVDIQVRATDDNGHSIDKTITLNITDAGNEVRRTASDVFDPFATDRQIEFPNSVTAFSSGGFMIVDLFLDGFTAGIAGQAFDAAAQKSGDEFPIVLPPGPRQASIAPLANGGFVAVYDTTTLVHDDETDTDVTMGTVGVQKYDATGHAVGSEALLEPDTATNRVHNPRVASLEGGGFVVTYEVEIEGGDGGFQPWAQVFGADGLKVGDEINIGDIVTRERSQVEVVARPGGGFVVVWYDDRSDIIQGQIFDADRHRVGDVFTALPNAMAVTNDIAFAVLANGDMVVGWAARDDDLDPQSLTEAFQLLNPDGVAIGGPVEADSSSWIYDDTALHITATPDGGFVMTWVGQDDGVSEENRAFGKFFTSGGAPVGERFVINDASGTAQNAAQSAVLAGGGVVLAWQQDGQDDNGASTSDTFARVLALAALTGFNDIHGTPADNTLDGTPADDRFWLEDGGKDTATGHEGNDGFYVHGTVDPQCTFDGGPGFDQVGVQGNLGSPDAPFVLGPEFLLNIEQMVLLPGIDTRFGDDGSEHYDYHFKCVDENVAAGRELAISWNALRDGEDVSFDGVEETDGSFLTFAGHGVDTILGGQQSDGFHFGSGAWGSGDKVDGQGGDDNQLGLHGNYTAAGSGPIVFGAGQLLNMNMIVCMSGGDARFEAPAGGGYSYDLTMNDGNVAAGRTLTISANTLQPAGSALTAPETLTFDGSAETDGHFTIYAGAGPDDITGGQLGDTIFGGLSTDLLHGGGGPDVFLYTSASESTPDSMDELFGFVEGSLINLLAIDAIEGGDDDAFDFIGSDAFSQTAGQLRAYESEGGWFVEGDIDGDGAADLGIHIVEFETGVTESALGL